MNRSCFVVAVCAYWDAFLTETWTGRFLREKMPKRSLRSESLKVSPLSCASPLTITCGHAFTVEIADVVLLHCICACSAMPHCACLRQTGHHRRVNVKWRVDCYPALTHVGLPHAEDARPVGVQKMAEPLPEKELAGAMHSHGGECKRI